MKIREYFGKSPNSFVYDKFDNEIDVVMMTDGDFVDSVDEDILISGDFDDLSVNESSFYNFDENDFDSFTFDNLNFTDIENIDTDLLGTLEIDPVEDYAQDIIDAHQDLSADGEFLSDGDMIDQLL